MSNAIILPPAPLAAVTASSSAAGHTPDYVGNDYLGVTWQSNGGTTSQYLTIDLGADVEFDTIALFGLTGAALTWQMQIKAATSAQGSSFPGGSWVGSVDQLLAGSAMPTSGRGKALWLAPAVSPPPPSRYIRITLGAPSNSVFTVARVVIGKRFQPSINFKFGAAFGVRDLGKIDFSSRGVLLRRYGAKLRTTGLTFPHVHRDKIDAVIQPLMERIGNTDCVALVTDPDAHEQRQNRMYFGPLIGDQESIWARPGGLEWRANMVGMDI